MIILVLCFVAFAREASASWWGPPSCDSRSVLEKVSYEVSSRYLAEKIVPGKSEVDRWLQQYLEFVPQNVEVIAALQVDKESRHAEARLCKFEGRVYLDEGDAKEILRLANSDPRLVQHLEGGGYLPSFIRFSVFLNHGYRSTLIYRASYNTDGEEDIEVLSEVQELM